MALSVTQDKAGFDEADRINKAQNEEFEKLNYTAAQDAERARMAEEKAARLAVQQMKDSQEARKQRNEDAIAQKAKDAKALEAMLQEHANGITKKVVEDLDEIHNSSAQQDKAISENRAKDQPDMEKIKKALEEKEKIELEAAEQKKTEDEAAAKAKAAADKKDQDAKM